MITQDNTLLPKIKELYAKYKGDYKRINFIGKLDESAQKDDVFNDTYYLNIDNDVWYWQCTCNPGKHCTETRQGGAAHLVYGFQPDIWCLETHMKSNPGFAHLALCSRPEFKCKPTTIWRDVNKNYIQEKTEPIQTGFFGINCHRASINSVISKIGLYSEGCIVTPDFKDFSFLITTLKKQPEVIANSHFTFGFLLTNIKEW
jgi:hypothetical protein